MRDLGKAKWIWQNRENTPDEYVEFSFCFAMPKNKNAIIDHLQEIYEKTEEKVLRNKRENLNRL